MTHRPRRSRRPSWSSGAAAAAVALLLLAAAPPDDPLVPQQGHLTQVRAFDAWDVSRGEGVIVAVLDTGVDLDHPDLEGQLVDGVDLVEPDTPPDDPQGHGTLVAGIVAAVAGNGRGVAGVAPDAQVMPVRVLDAEGRGTSDVVAEGIRWAVDHGAHVVNLSLAEVDPGDDDAFPLTLLVDQRVQQAIADAWEQGVLVVAAAGNEGRDRTPYDEDVPVVVVGAATPDDQVWPQSNHDDATLFAPGVAVLSTWSEGRYAKADGTSFSTPIVAGGAALLLAAGLDAEQAVQALTGTAVDIGAGLGRVDLAAAVAAAAPHLPPVEPPPPPPPPPPTPAVPTPPAGPVEVTEPPPATAPAVPTLPTAPLPTVPEEPTEPEGPAVHLEEAEPVTEPPTPTPSPRAERSPGDGGVIVERGGGAAARTALLAVAGGLLLGDVVLLGAALARRTDRP